MVMLFVMGRGGYRGDKEGARVLDPMGGGAPRSPCAAITGLAPSAVHEGWSQKTGATSPQLFTSRASQRNLRDLRNRILDFKLHLADDFMQSNLLTSFFRGDLLTSLCFSIADIPCLLYQLVLNHQCLSFHKWFSWKCLTRFPKTYLRMAVSFTLFPVTNNKEPSWRCEDSRAISEDTGRASKRKSTCGSVLPKRETTTCGGCQQKWVAFHIKSLNGKCRTLTENVYGHKKTSTACLSFSGISLHSTLMIKCYYWMI